MAISLFVMPTAGAGGKGDDRRPKYRDSLFPELQYAPWTYGDETWCLVAIIDITPAVEAALNTTAADDVFELPADLDLPIGVVVVRDAIRARLEAVNIPGTWVETTSTYREVVRVIGACCQFAQRYQGGVDAVRWFSGNITLNSTFASLPLLSRQALLAAGNSNWQLDNGQIVHFDTSALTGTSTLRQVLYSMASQYIALGLRLVIAGVAL